MVERDTNKMKMNEKRTICPYSNPLSSLSVYIIFFLVDTIEIQYDRMMGERKRERPKSEELNERKTERNTMIFIFLFEY